MTPVDEDGESAGYIMPMIERLVADLQDSGACIYTDKAFTSIRLARALAKSRMAIVGMLRTSGRPKNRDRGDEHY
jgi:nitrogenase molybdenum-iron protein alpha/beta subunit